MASITVRKFGGTSMGSADNIRTIANIIRAHRGEQAIVVSAMSGITNDLIALIEAAGKNHNGKVRTYLMRVTKKHTRTAMDLIAAPAARAAAVSYVDATMSRLAGVLETVDSTTPPPRVLDSILAVGEELAAYLLAAHLTDSGVPAMQVNLKQTIPGTHTIADGAFFVAAEKHFAKKLHTVLQKKHIPVATGYFGRVPGGMSASVGRGYSDFCAALVAAGLRARELEIWTDVSGVYSADPRKIREAEIIDRMTFESAAEMAHFGAKVIHPQCIHPAVRANIPVRIKNTFEPTAPGTRILQKVPRHRRPVGAITAKKPVTVVHVVSLRKMVQHDFLAKVFQIFAQHDVPVDVVSTSEVSVSLTCDRAITKVVAGKLQKTLADVARVTVVPDQAIICLVGGGMVGNSTIAGQIFTVIGKAKINVRQISQGASERNITFIVDEKDADTAVAKLHKAFIA